MSIVKYKGKNGVYYAYESRSHWNSELHQSRPIRKYLGRVDPVSGAIIPTAGKRGRRATTTTQNSALNGAVCESENSKSKDENSLNSDTSSSPYTEESLIAENNELKDQNSNLRQLNEALRIRNMLLEQVISQIKENIALVEQ